MEYTHWKSFEDYQNWQKENEKKLLAYCKEPEEFYFLLKFHADLGLSCHNRGKNELFEENDHKYRMFRKRAKELNIDLSNYPETLEELIK